MEPLVRQVSDYIAANGLPANDKRMLVAISGGADSVALLRVMRLLDYDCGAVHCNFHLRGEESMRDEQFVRNLCTALGIPCEFLSFDTESYAKEHGLSIEMAAREQRYKAFEEVRKRENYDYICVAHHLEDSAETILINLIRGTGIEGLTGISPINGKIIRPLLGTRRQEIEDFLASIGQSFVEDSTNKSDNFTRNKIRHNILPLMEEINPAVITNIVRTAKHLRGVSDLCEGKSTDEAGITLLHGILHPYGYNETEISNLLTALRNRRQTLLPSGIENDDISITVRCETYDKNTMPRTNSTFCLDVRQLCYPITLRRWKEGDRMQPFGMKGSSKLVSDILTDAKLSRQERALQQVLCIGDKIAWVVNIRSDERFRVPDDTKEILLFEVQQKN
ncbi:MAG: tRNA lysidine(34) synthetase TilS [Bacteroidaceae bacterium]|nr:tRNA lysidine(34) synthetase TilS [Bacteroidaceae bacterium]